MFLSKRYIKARLLSVVVVCLSPLSKDTDQQRGELFFSSVIPPSPSPSPSSLERPFEEEMWLLVLGYRHWVMVAMVHLLSTEACPSCEFFE